jgi:hypothetical protein
VSAPTPGRVLSVGAAPSRAIRRRYRRAEREPLAAACRPLDASLDDRAARLGRVYDRLVHLTSRVYAYRRAGLLALAQVRDGQRVDTLAELSPTELGELLMYALDQHAPVLYLCRCCRAGIGPATTCAECATGSDAR